MKMLVRSGVIAVQFSAAAAQFCVPSSTIGPAPTGTPVAGDYTDQYRPQIHYSPPQGFMNDPNGMFLDANGTYHFYYQLNPTALVAGNQHWGHATSKDLYHWTNQPIAIAPENDNEQIFSGSAVTDPNNTSGFFPNQTNGVVAFYTLNTLVPATQTQHIAYSFDGGYTFTKYSGNPVINVNSSQHRDPKAFWHAPTQKWVVVVAYSMEYTASFYTSPDLKNWTFVSNFTGQGFEGLQWECPNLVEMPFVRNASVADPTAAENVAETRWLFFLSVNPGAPQGGSISWYLVGDFNGTHFLPDDGVTRFSDYFKDNYAGQFFYNVPPSKPQVQIAWASNWQYTNNLPTTANKWRSTTSLPRQMYLANTTRGPRSLVSTPYPFDALYSPSQPLASNSSLANASLAVPLGASVPSGALAFTVNITGVPPPATPPTGGFNFSLVASATGEVLRGGFVITGDTGVWLDRSGLRGYTAADSPFWTGQFSFAYPVDYDTRAVSVQVVFDRSIVEVFVDRGVRRGTAVVFPEGEFDFLTIASEVDAGVSVSAEVWGLKSTWADEGGAMVKGNSTQMMRMF